MNNQSGFIKTILIIIVIVILLSLLGINLREIASSPLLQSNLDYLIEILNNIWLFIKDIWQTYLAEPMAIFWKKITN